MPEADGEEAGRGRPYSTRGDEGHGDRPVPATEHRNDLQGLRAVAVLLVALDHAGIGYLEGGFVGVDVFFVLSGFLITGLLLSGAAKRGYVSLTGFYVRRARRILPAAALTLVASQVVAYYLLNSVRAKQVVLDSFSASLFAANIHFANQETDYFARTQPPSPVLHFWTLAVEEQFYLVWPALFALVLFGVALSRRSRRDASVLTQREVRRLLIVVIVAAMASLAWSIHYTNVLPAATYFSTFARAWELALGAAIAIGTSQLMRVSAKSRLVRVSASSRVAMGWLGLIGIGCAGVMFSSSTPFPGYAALLPTVGAALVICAGIGGQQPRFGAGRLLATAPMRYVGDRSYTFYLWHWPVLIIAVQYAGHEFPLGTRLLLLVGAFLLSIITYGLFENPIRQARWSAPATVTAGLVSVAAVVFVAAFTLNSIYTEAARVEVIPTATLFTDSEQATKATDTSEQAVAATEAGRALPAVIAAVKAAQRGESIPSGLTPPVGELLDDAYVYSLPPGCAPLDSETASNICRFGDTSKTRSIVVIGDSHAQMWLPAILRMAEQDGWVVLPIIKSACTPNTWIDRTAPAQTRGGPTPGQCRGWYRWAVGQIKALRPEVTLISGCCGGSTGSGAEAIKNAFFSLTAATKRFSKRLVMIADDEGISQEPVDCLLARGATMTSCTTTLTEERLYLNDDIAALAKINGFGFIETRGWFCSQNQCPMVIGRTVVYRDKGHITKTYAQELVTPFRAAFRRAIRDVKSP